MLVNKYSVGNDDDGGVDIDVIERANADKISGCLYFGVFCGRFLCLALVLGVFWAILDGFKFVSFLGWVCVWFQKSVCVRLAPDTWREIAVCICSSGGAYSLFMSIVVAVYYYRK